MRCAVLEYTGPYTADRGALQLAVLAMAAGQRPEPGDFPMFEEYLNDPKTTPAAQLKTRIYLPLAWRLCRPARAGPW